jgi:hypothetical protein
MDARRGGQLTPAEEALLGEAAKLRFPDAVPVLLQLAEEAQVLANPARAQAAITRLRGFPLEPADRFRTDLIDAALKLDARQPETALAILEPLTVPTGATGRARLGELRADAFERVRRFEDAARERARIHALLAPASRPANARALLDDLGNLSPAALQALRSDEREFLPWLELAGILYGGTPLDRQIERYRGWEARWSATVAPGDLPDGVRQMARMDAARPDRVALLLPASGPLAVAARAVRDGFVGAMFGANGNRPEVLAFDVQAGGVAAAYARAVEAGADVVIGPLDKSDVQKLNALAQLPVPVLALNYLPAGERARSGLHQFGLAPEDEGTAIADQVARDGRASILLLTTKADWATRAAAAFTERWQAHGGQVAQTATLDDMQAVDRDLRAALLVPEAESRHAAVASVLGFTPDFDRRYRSDIDAIVLLARPTEAAIVMPSLRSYFATELPMYASSHINGGGSVVLAELGGVTFCDTPWRIHGDPLRARLARLWPAANGETGSLYALGADAWILHDRLPLLARRGARLNGMTGVISLGEDARLAREPAWARFNGKGATPLATGAQ